MLHFTAETITCEPRSSSCRRSLAKYGFIPETCRLSNFPTVSFRKRHFLSAVEEGLETCTKRQDAGKLQAWGCSVDLH